ncbi:hypothetical protein Z043_111000 [Scleropages formosus]|uniref:INPP5B PH domain-containing protein n=1 Tax=Scleropages formosus TaxID=113540 RepID=A0A0P7VAR5_SCLFO|nr:hypothetical protein Z043_111000 [Scleropages formosus]
MLKECVQNLVPPWLGRAIQAAPVLSCPGRDWGCKHAAQCLLIVDNVTESRLLGLVEHTGAHARMAITGEDVTLDEIIPISHDFEIVEGADTRVRVRGLELELEVRLPFGSHTRLFLHEVNKAWSEVCRKSVSSVPASQFEWLSEYHKSSKISGLDRLSSMCEGAAFPRMNQFAKSQHFNTAQGKKNKHIT